MKQCHYEKNVNYNFSVYTM